MKKLLLIIAFLPACSSYIHAQQDPAAKKILDRVATKSREYSTIQADFTLTIENRREDFTSSSKGKLKIKGNKYYMEMTDTKMYFNGTTLWTLMEDIKEVTITEPDKSTDDFVENPLVLFDLYNRDFKYKLVGEVMMDLGWVYEIDLFPNNLEQPYSRFKVFITKGKEELYMVQAVGKDGINYTAFLENAVYDQVIDDSIFTYPSGKHKGVEVVDMRY